MADSPTHVDISDEINNWKNAVKGKDVRGASVQAFTKLQEQTNICVDYITDKGSRIEQTVREVQEVNEAARKAVGHADDISEQNKKYVDNTVEEYKQYADKKLEETEGQRQLAEEAKDGADDAAKLAESWAHGSTGIRQGENTDNASYWSQQSKTDADRAKEEADRASQYSQITAPDFYLDIETGALYQKGGAGVDFAVADAILYWKIVA